MGDSDSLLTPEDIQRIKKVWWPNIQKLCDDYLALWDRVKQLEQEIAALMR